MKAEQSFSVYFLNGKVPVVQTLTPIATAVAQTRAENRMTQISDISFNQPIQWSKRFETSFR